MAHEVEETSLPGVGMRLSFMTDSGHRVSVLHHHSGRQELFAGEPDDPDASQLVAELTGSESQLLAELLGGSRIVRELDRLQQSIAGLTIEWLQIPADSPCDGRTIGDTELRRRTGVTVVAVMRDGKGVPAPGPEYRIEAGDTLVVMGPTDQIEHADALLRG